MNNERQVDKALELVERFRATVRDFTAREETLNREFQTRLVSVQRRRDEEMEALNLRLPEELEREEATFRAASEVALARHARRKTRIGQLQKIIKKRAAEWIEDKEGRRKHKLQTETLQNERGHTAGIAATEQACAEFTATLAAEQQVLAALEEKARQTFKGFGAFERLLTGVPSANDLDPARDEYQLFDELRALLTLAEEELRRHRRKLLPALFRALPLLVVLALAPLAAVPILRNFGIQSFTWTHAGASTGGAVILGIALFIVAKQQARQGTERVAKSLAKAHRLHDVCAEKCAARRVQELERIENEFIAKREWIAQEWDGAVSEAASERVSLPQAVEAKATRAATTNDRLHSGERQRLESIRAQAVARLRQTNAAKLNEVTTAAAGNESKINGELASRWQALEAEWKTRVQPLYGELGAATAAAENLFPDWPSALWRNWSPPPQFAHASKFAHLDVDLPTLAEGTPKDPRLALPGPAKFPVPLLLTYPQQGSLLIETSNTGRDEALAALNNIVLRLLSTAPPGRLSFTVVDPVGLGQSFSGVMHLADYADHVINSRIWTQTQQVEERLAALNEHMEKVIQMYLRNEYATIADYNEQAGTIAEKYHFVVVADFPVNFSETAARRLLSIATSGARCGVYTLIHWDRRQPVPQEFMPDELRKSSISLTAKGKEFVFTGNFVPGTNLLLDPPPSVEVATEFIHKVGVTSRDSNRIEVPFSQITPSESERWTLDTTSELRVAVGRTGATKLQYLAMGKGTRQHGLVAGKTGSGKSTLFHVLITNLALWCSPEQVEFYLIDFKKGVEFKCYGTHRLPHARVIAIESDREFGLSVLQRLDEELKRRGDLFRQLGVQDVAGYKKAGGTEPIPRTLLLIDEFQEFFVEDDKIAQTASLLLDRIVRQGRAFGIHALLGSQTLGGAYTMARTTLGQMVIRIALQCNEADAYLIMDDSNPAPRLLSRPGEGIYNDTAGTVEGNSPFQVVWLSDDERDAALVTVRGLADQRGSKFPPPVVFEGNAPSDIRENAELAAALAAHVIKPTHAARLWLGAPNSIKGPTEAVFHRQSGNNLLLIGHRDEATTSIFSAGLLALAAQFPRDAARFILCDGSPPGTPQRDYLESVVRAIPHPVTLAQAGDLPQLMKGLSDELKRRTDDARGAEGPPVFLFIHGMQKFNKLRYEEDFGFASADADAPPNPAALLNTLICEGTRLGFHVIASCDSYNNLSRFLSRKALTEFEMRVLFQMSANDSASLIDSPKAANLGLHRALYSNAHEGRLETFRPYALPGDDWIAEAGRQLLRLLG